ncbi:MAG: NAD-dependent epimerase/dehydratase family protein [Betaproteobacteria bacterium]|nr:NAD-dependent epimerase/dehydratase family protein [Betaproteobacteria bacterium]
MRRLLIVGCGDVGMRLLPLLHGHYRIYALTHSESRMDLLRASGAVPVRGDLDRVQSLRRLGGLAEDIVHMAPPPGTGRRDPRTAHLLRALASGRSLPQRLVYLSTTGVYGDCHGEWVDESRPVDPQTDRAARRVDAERQLRIWGRRTGTRVSILRVPGIYATDRLPLGRIRTGTPALVTDEDPFTNHVHADDLARIVSTALTHGRSGRAYNAADHSVVRMGDYFDLVARAAGLPPVPRITRTEARTSLPPTLLSFMSESRRIRNRRLCRELGYRFLYPTVEAGVAAAFGAGVHPDRQGTPYLSGESPPRQPIPPSGT